MPYVRSANPSLLLQKAGAGKTTVASRVAQEFSAILISEDIWLTQLFGDQMKTFGDYIKFSQKLKTVVGPLVVDRLTTGQSARLDFQANTRTGRAWFRSVFEQAGAAHVLHGVNTPDEACLSRIAKRNAERPEGSHHLTEEDFVCVSSFFQAPEEAEGFSVKSHAAGAR
ncbi:ATP-binding protein [Chloracidobacterium validum]|uniref:ATP-binding protein n=1 Tax=Chloracidobacterium validum TaxID=2821543 RepID=A0ABX8BDI3_9BACT|nr:ATP-binding protein [Chloracidobacterium validum]